MRKKQTGLILAACLLLGSSVVMAQQAKTSMTNADVVEMVKAGLPESTVVLAIQQSQTDFDTSPQALILLKKQGVSQKVLEAMLQPQAATASAPPTNRDANSPFSEQPGAGDGAGVSLTEVVLVDGAKRTPMKRSEPNSRGSTGGMIMNPFGKVKVRAALNGNHAQLRITNTSPVFELGLPSDVNAADQLVLIKLNPKSDRREVEVGRAGITGSSMGFRKEAIVATTFEEVKPLTVGGGVKYTLYRVKVVSPLPPGEYAFAPRNLYYDFGVDKGQ
ncbi:MAG: hypothetical protein LC802_17280 [Acidobacteria bacterium]|nr:hypothetical protein [Acidobacteriota bacterium]